MPRPASSILLIGAALACARGAAVPPSPQPVSWVSETLFFGRNVAGAGRPDSARVSQAEWRGFADEVLARWLPNGYTVLDALGSYVDGGRSVAESTKVVIVVRPAEPRAAVAVDSVVEAYRVRFRQRSVGRIVSAVTTNLSAP